jgi:sec-independent protein translocase protein TatA
MLDGLMNPVHIMIILGVVLLLFGPKRLPEMGQKVGQALRDFKSATSDIRAQTGINDITDSVNDIKSGLSLTAIVGSDPAAGVAAEPPSDGSLTGEPHKSESPVGVNRLTARRGEHMPAAADEPLEPTAVLATSPPAISEQAASGDCVAIGGECGVESFGKLKRSKRP